MQSPLAAGVRDTLKLLQPASSAPLLLRQIPLRRDGAVIGSIDLALERAYIWRDFAASEIAEIPGDDKARELIEKLSIPQIPSGAIARDLQPYIVQVPPRARERLIVCGRAMFAAPKLRLDQFAVLTDIQLYRQDVGLVWEDADYLSAEGLVW